MNKMFGDEITTFEEKTLSFMADNSSDQVHSVVWFETRKL